jgi:hypothetical protein
MFLVFSLNVYGVLSESKHSLFHAFFTLACPLFSLIGFIVLLAKCQFIKENPVMLFLFSGAIHSQSVTRMIIASVTK